MQKLPVFPFESRQRERTVLSPDAHLELVNNNGTIEVIGWDRTEVSIETRIRADEKGKLTCVRQSLTPTPQGLKLEIIEKYPPQDYDWRRDGSKYVFYPASTELTVRLPRQASVTIRSANAGLTLSGLLGPLDAQTYNGKLHFQPAPEANQRIVAHTFNGRLLLPEPLFRWREQNREATAQLGQGQRSVRLDSYNGEVEVRLLQLRGAAIR